MMDLVISALAPLGRGILDQLPGFIGVGVVFTLVGFFARSKASSGPWWRKPDLLTDLIYSFLLPTVSAYVRLSFLILGAGLITGSFASEGVAAYLAGGHGVLSGLGYWAQMAVYVVLSDVMLYWTHRIFHGHSLWRYHAIHHSSEHLDWLSAFRFHPVNIVFHSVLVDSILLLAGIAPQVLIALAPFQIAISAMVHADVDWDFGPFRYVVASPVFHRWHHTSPDRGGDMNFAPTFPVIDMIFGTFYMPKGELPDHFGVDDPAFPQGFEQQLLYPFKGRTSAPAQENGAAS